MALPRGAAVAEVPPFVTGLPYLAYAFGGTTPIATGSVTSNAWLGWTGTRWETITTTGAALAPREFASAVFLWSCEGTGVPCIVLVGGRTPGTLMTASGLGLYTLKSLSSATPVVAAVTAVAGTFGAPTPRHSMASAATPDGMTVVLFGGKDDSGTVFSDTFGLQTLGWSGSSADASSASPELLQLITNTADALRPNVVKAKNYPCNTARETQKCYASAGTYYANGCWGTGSKWSPIDSFSPTPYLGPPSPGNINVAASYRCEGYGSNNLIGWAANAIDGNTEGNFILGSVSRSNTDGGINYAWPYYNTWTSSMGIPPVHISFDLGVTQSYIQQIWLYWRTDCCLTRTGGFEVWIGNTGPDNPYGAGNVKIPNPFSDAVLSPTIIFTNDVSGRFVYVTLPGQQRVLGVAEIKIFQRRKYTCVFFPLHVTISTHSSPSPPPPPPPLHSYAI